MKCECQWINKHGEPTPDENPAVGFAIVTFFGHVGDELHQKSFPICEEHLARMPKGKSFVNGEPFSEWDFLPFVDNGIGTESESYD